MLNVFGSKRRHKTGTLVGCERAARGMAMSNAAGMVSQRPWCAKAVDRQSVAEGVLVEISNKSMSAASASLRRYRP